MISNEPSRGPPPTATPPEARTYQRAWAGALGHRRDCIAMTAQNRTNMTAIISPESNTRATTLLAARPVAPAWHAGTRSAQAPLRIAQLAPPFEAIPPRAYGGTERVVSVLTEEL